MIKKTVRTLGRIATVTIILALGIIAGVSGYISLVLYFGNVEDKVQTQNDIRFETIKLSEQTNKEYYQIDTRRYYYNLLSEQEQQMYDVIDSSKEAIFENQQITLATIEGNYETCSRIIDKVMWAYKLDNPISTIWLNRHKKYLNVYGPSPENPEVDIVDVIIGPWKDTGSYYDFESKEELIEAIEQVEEITHEFVQELSGTNVEKLRSINAWIKDGSKYDETTILSNNNNVYGAIIQKECVCGGYSYSFKYVADMAGIPVTTVVGFIENDKDIREETEINHAWNNIYIAGEWYLVDVTSGIFGKPIESTEEIYYPVNYFELKTTV